MNNTLTDNQMDNNQIIINTTSMLQSPKYQSYPQSDMKSKYYKQINKIKKNKLLKKYNKNQESDYSSLIKKYQNEETEIINFKSTENYISSINSFQNNNNNQNYYNIENNNENNYNNNNQIPKSCLSSIDINYPNRFKLEKRINTIQKEIKELNGKMDFFIQNYTHFPSYHNIKNYCPVNNIFNKRISKSYYKKKIQKKIKNRDIQQKKMDMTLKMFDYKIRNFNLEFNKVDQKALSKAISPSMKSISYSIKKNNKSFYENKIIDKGFEISNLVSQIQKRLDTKVKNEYYKYYINKKDLLNKF
jgi:hypothetical protein